MKRPRLAAYFRTYLACSFAAAAFAFLELAPDSRPDECLGRLGLSFLLGLMGIPVRMLLGVFPESSTHSMVRLLRRMALGVLCGPLPFLMIYLFLRGEKDQPQPGDLLAAGILFGAVAGLIDSLYWDDRESG